MSTMMEKSRLSTLKRDIWERKNITKDKVLCSILYSMDRYQSTQKQQNDSNEMQSNGSSGATRRDSRAKTIMTRMMSSKISISEKETSGVGTELPMDRIDSPKR